MLISNFPCPVLWTEVTWKQAQAAAAQVNGDFIIVHPSLPSSSNDLRAFNFRSYEVHSIHTRLIKPPPCLRRDSLEPAF